MDCDDKETLVCTADCLALGERDMDDMPRHEQTRRDPSRPQSERGTPNRMDSEAEI